MSRSHKKKVPAVYWDFFFYGVYYRQTLAMYDLHMERVVLITGSTRGIGLAAATEFLKNADKVVIFCRHETHVDEAVERLSGSGGEILSLTGDVRELADVRRIVAATVERFGHIDILINNAGAAVWKPIEEQTENDYHEVMDTNFKGSWLFTREVVPLMKEQRRGTVIQVSSGLGEKGAKNYSVYSPSKFALNGLTEAMADEIPDLTFYSVLPGAVNTKLHLDIHPWEDGNDMMQPEHIGQEIFTLAEGKKRSGYKLKVYR